MLIVGVLAGLLVGLAWTLHYEVVGRAQGQAAMVAGRFRTTGSRPTGATLMNASELPVFGVVAWAVTTGGTAPGTGEEWVTRIRRREEPPGAQGPPRSGPVEAREALGPALLALLPPGRTELDQPTWARFPAGGQPAVEVAFTDASGQHWILRGGGRLARIDTPAWRHYGFTSPDAV